MENRTLLAIAIAFAIIFFYQYFYIKYYKPEPQKIQKQAKLEKQDVPIKPKEHIMPEIVKDETIPFEEEEIRVDTELYTAIFTTRGATIKHFEIKKYKDEQGNNIILLNKPGLKPPLAIGSNDKFNLTNMKFNVSGYDMFLNKNNPSGELIFEYKNQNVFIKRTYTFYNNTYKIDISDEVSGLNEYWVTLGTDFGIHDRKSRFTHIGPVLLIHSNRIQFDAKKLKDSISYKEGLKWIAQEDKYFFASLVPISTLEEAKIWKIKESPIIALKGKSGTNEYILYAGPKEHDRLKKLNVGLEYIVDFGFFSIIARPLFWFLKFLYKLIGNYGWAIVVLTVILRVPFIPLFNRSQRSMKKMQENMQKIQPRLKEIREKYKKDPQKMNKEIMELYKKHKVNPLGGLSGCLPLLLQLPIFLALYKILLTAIELRGAPFILWLKDLSAPDTLFGHIPSWFPLIGGFAVGPLPIVMGLTMLIQQKMTPSTTIDPRQAKFMMFMPIIFMFLFLNFASGLVLYWLITNILSIAQQYYTNKKLVKEST